MKFATEKYGVTFPMFSKIEVNGDGATPLYQYLRDAAPREDGATEITWNFEKFLVDASGNVVKRFSPKTTPEEIEAQLSELL